MAAMAQQPVVAGAFVVGAIVLTKWLNISPLLLLTLGLLFAFLVVGSRPSGGAEQFSPVYESGVLSGLQYGVAAVQGRRPYMEDMHQIVDFRDERAAVRAASP